MTLETVYILIEQQFLSVNGKDRKRPTWYRQEAVLKRETRLVVDLLCASISDMDLCKEQGENHAKHHACGTQLTFVCSPPHDVRAECDPASEKW